MDREQLNQLQSQLIGGEPEDEAEHFMRCPGCGQMFDMRRLGDVLHHDEPGHQPLVLNS